MFGVKRCAVTNHLESADLLRLNTLNSERKCRGLRFMVDDNLRLANARKWCALALETVDQSRSPSNNGIDINRIARIDAECFTKLNSFEASWF